MSMQPFAATAIVLSRFLMLSTIKFDSKFLFVAIKIQNIPANRMLSPKLGAGKTTITEQFP